MSTTVTYKGSTLTTVSNQTKTLKTAGKYMEGDVIIQDVSGGAGAVIQDENGGLHFPEDEVNAFSDAVTELENGGFLHTITGVMASDGLEYEEGTWSPSEDVARGEIFFSNTHTDTPFFIMLTDAEGDYFDTLQSNLAFFYMDWEKVFGEPFYTASGSMNYGLTYNRYRANADNGTTAQYNSFSQSSSDPDDSNNSYFRYFATNTKFMPYTNGTTRYWRAGRTYKWIAVWR